MERLEYDLSTLELDAALLGPSADVKNIEALKNKQLSLNKVLNDFTERQYKSMFFLLMDHLGDCNFINLTKQDKICLRRKFEEMYIALPESILTELLGTMKMFVKLKKLDICSHVFESFQESKFSRIDGFWKMLYFLCEELNKDDLEILKHFVPADFQEHINDAEDWFFWAFKNKIFSKSDLVPLKKIFNNYPMVLKRIKDFEAKQKLYFIRTPTTDSNCGIALILNYDKFDDESKFEKRRGSQIDVNSLKILWHSFGFKTEEYSNLKFSETITLLKFYASLDHSNYDAFVCCILSHGRSNSVISSDCKVMLIPELIAEITNNCSSLSLKPKLFFIQACQGVNIQEGVNKPIISLDVAAASEIDESKKTVPPIASDVLIAISSIDGFVSYRDAKRGSWFINSLCTSMMQSGDTESILDVIIDVNNLVRKNRVDYGPGRPRRVQQIVNCINSFGKKLVLKKRDMP